MRTFKAVRRHWAQRCSHLASSVAPRLPPGAIQAAERLFRWAGPSLPVLPGIVERNMRSAGLFTREAFCGYFDQVARHYAHALHIFRQSSEPGAVVRLAERRIEPDESMKSLPALLANSGGLLIAPPHVSSYLLSLVRLNQIVPLAVYLRWSPDERKRKLKERWCRAAGLHVILEPPSETDPTSRAMACVEAIREGRALVMTPDLAQKSDQGVKVTLLGRQVYLPSGPASLAMLAGVPLVPVFGRMASERHQIYTCDPIRIPMLKRSEGGRQASLEWATQRWTDCFERYLRHQPHVWFFWGDKHWTRVFRNDPRYVAPLEKNVGSSKISETLRAIEPEAQARGSSEGISNDGKATCADNAMARTEGTA